MEVNQKKILGFLVHSYTALGGLIGFIALIFVNENNISEAFLLLLLTMVIDSTDGIMARKLKIWELFPDFDGAEMDNVIDIFTYAWIPFFIMYKIDVLPSPWFIAFPIIGALYAYGQVNMKTDDGY